MSRHFTRYLMILIFDWGYFKHGKKGYLDSKFYGMSLTHWLQLWARCLIFLDVWIQQFKINTNSRLYGAIFWLFWGTYFTKNCHRKCFLLCSSTFVLFTHAILFLEMLGVMSQSVTQHTPSSRTVLCCGEHCLCLVGCLAASLALTHIMLVVLFSMKTKNP